MTKRLTFTFVFIILSAVTFIVGMYFNLYDNIVPSIPASLTQPIFSSQLPVFSGTNAKAACLIDAKSGAVLYSHNSSLRLPMASTTKIMTALTALDVLSPYETITVPKEAVGVEGSSIYLCNNEEITVETLLYGLLLKSGNDAAAALAYAASGSIDEFAALMNKKAQSLGLIDSHFTNPHGLHDDNHYTTAYELCLIAKAAMENDTISKITSTKSYTAPANNLSAVRSFTNHNRLLFTLDGCIGVKTGFTKAAGRCLVSAIQSGDDRYIAVTLNDGSDWADHRNMLTFAKDNFFTLEIASPLGFVIYHKGQAYSNPDGIYLTSVKNDPLPEISFKISFDGEYPCVNYFLNSAPAGKFYLEPQQKKDFRRIQRKSLNM